MKKIIAIYGYPMDNSVRSKVFDSMQDAHTYEEKWKNICYLVVAFETNAEIYLGNQEETK